MFKGMGETMKRTILTLGILFLVGCSSTDIPKEDCAFDFFEDKEQAVPNGQWFITSDDCDFVKDVCLNQIEHNKTCRFLEQKDWNRCICELRG